MTARTLMTIALLAAAVTAAPASAVTELKRGDPAPPVILDAIAPPGAARIDTTALRGKPVILLFGEASQDKMNKTRRAMRLVAAALGDPRLAAESLPWILILSKSSDPGRLDLETAAGGRTVICAHDTARTAFGAYHVTVLPSTVVVDRQGKVVYAVAGLPPRFGDVVADAILLAADKIDLAAFERTLRPAPNAAVNEDQLRAARLFGLARQMARHGLHESAEAKFREALAVDPDSIPVRVALAALLLERSPPGSDEGGITESEHLVRAVLRADPSQPRAHYLLGLIKERRGDGAGALASYRRAAELLLEF